MGNGVCGACSGAERCERRLHTNAARIALQLRGRLKNADHVLKALARGSHAAGGTQQSHR